VKKALVDLDLDHNDQDTAKDNVRGMMQKERPVLSKAASNFLFKRDLQPKTPINSNFMGKKEGNQLKFCQTTNLTGKLSSLVPINSKSSTRLDTQPGTSKHQTTALSINHARVLSSSSVTKKEISCFNTLKASSKEHKVDVNQLNRTINMACKQ